MAPIGLTHIDGIVILSIILPAYNPAPGWAALILQQWQHIRSRWHDLDIEFIIVNDGSLSPSWAAECSTLASIPSIYLTSYDINRGKGYALRQGVAQATGDIIVYTDIDFPYSDTSIDTIITALSADTADIVIGVKDAAYYDHVPPLRRAISRLLRWLIRTLLRIPTDDTQCGLKGFNPAGKALFLTTTIDRYLFDLEFVFLSARTFGIRLVTHEVSLRADVEFRKMNFGILRNEAWNFLRIFLRAVFGH